MYSIRKERRQTIPNLAIEVAIVLLLVTNSCVAQNKKNNIAENDDECLQGIISKEIKRHFISGELSPEENTYFWFSLNDVLMEFLKEKTNIEYHSANSMELSKSEWQMLFNKKEISHLLSQFSNPACEIDDVKLPEKFVISNPKEEKEKINGNGLLSAKYYNKTRLFLSHPVILSNKKYALIAYSAGMINSGQSGIHLYKKENGKWVFYKRLVGWIS